MPSYDSEIEFKDVFKIQEYFGAYSNKSTALVFLLLRNKMFANNSNKLKRRKGDCSETTFKSNSIFDNCRDSNALRCAILDDCSLLFDIK